MRQAPSLRFRVNGTGAGVRRAAPSFPAAPHSPRPAAALPSTWAPLAAPARAPPPPPPPPWSCELRRAAPRPARPPYPAAVSSRPRPPPAAPIAPRRPGWAARSVAGEGGGNARWAAPSWGRREPPGIKRPSARRRRRQPWGRGSRAAGWRRCWGPSTIWVGERGPRRGAGVGPAGPRPFLRGGWRVHSEAE